MDDDDDGGESMNAVYYGHLWTKQIKVRSAAKRLKHKRWSKKTGRANLLGETVLLGDVQIGTVKHLWRLHHKRKDSPKCPLLRR